MNVAKHGVTRSSVKTVGARRLLNRREIDVASNGNESVSLATRDTFRRAHAVLGKSSMARSCIPVEFTAPRTCSQVRRHRYTGCLGHNSVHLCVSTRCATKYSAIEYPMMKVLGKAHRFFVTSWRMTDALDTFGSIASLQDLSFNVACALQSITEHVTLLVSGEDGVRSFGAAAIGRREEPGVLGCSCGCEIDCVPRRQDVCSCVVVIASRRRRRPPRTPRRQLRALRRWHQPGHKIVHAAG